MGSFCRICGMLRCLCSSHSKMLKSFGKEVVDIESIEFERMFLLAYWRSGNSWRMDIPFLLKRGAFLCTFFDGGGILPTSRFAISLDSISEFTT
jgi:hypothetical protein